MQHTFANLFKQTQALRHGMKVDLYSTMTASLLTLLPKALVQLRQGPQGKRAEPSP
jgi:hypothetical protein